MEKKLDKIEILSIIEFVLFVLATLAVILFEIFAYSLILIFAISLYVLAFASMLCTECFKYEKFKTDSKIEKSAKNWCMAKIVISAVMSVLAFVVLILF